MTEATLDAPKQYWTLDEVRKYLDKRRAAYAVSHGTVIIANPHGDAPRIRRFEPDEHKLYRATYICTYVGGPDAT